MDGGFQIGQDVAGGLHLLEEHQWLLLLDRKIARTHSVECETLLPL